MRNINLAKVSFFFLLVLVGITTIGFTSILGNLLQGGSMGVGFSKTISKKYSLLNKKTATWKTSAPIKVLDIK